MSIIAKIVAIMDAVPVAKLMHVAPNGTEWAIQREGRRWVGLTPILAVRGDTPEAVMADIDDMQREIAQ